jgi:hypothetical protein
VPGADGLEFFVHDAVGEFGAVALAAEVAEVEVTQFGRHDLGGGLRRGVIGKVSVAAEDALFEAPGSADAILEHFDIVIGFEHQGMGGADAFEDQFGDVSQVGEEADIHPVGAQEESDGILGIMRDGEGFDEDIADLEAGAGQEAAAVEFCVEQGLDGFVGGLVAVDGDAEFVAERSQSLDMVAVLVGDEDAGQVLRGAAQGGEALADLAEAEARIDQDAGFVGFHVSAIAGGTAPQNRQSNGHRPTLRGRPEAGNAIQALAVVRRGVTSYAQQKIKVPAVFADVCRKQMRGSESCQVIT